MDNNTTKVNTIFMLGTEDRMLNECVRKTLCNPSVLLPPGRVGEPGCRLSLGIGAIPLAIL